MTELGPWTSSTSTTPFDGATAGPSSSRPPCSAPTSDDVSNFLRQVRKEHENEAKPVLFKYAIRTALARPGGEKTAQEV